MDVPIDLSIILSIVAIVVSVSISIFTLWLTEFRGPDISLLNKNLKFEVNDEHTRMRVDENLRQGYTPRFLYLEPVSFIFANHGGKSGTIKDLKLNFIPHDLLKGFFEEFDFCFGEPNLPVTIKEGDNQHLKASFMDIHMIDWKRMALAEVLDPRLTINEMIIEALENSKKRFEGFCDFLSMSQELGRISCVITFTKGRFRTKVKEEKLLESIVITTRLDSAVSSLRDCLKRWESLAPTRAQLLNEIKQDIERLIRELKESLSISEKQVDESNITTKLRDDAWNNLRNIADSSERRLRWFLIKNEKGMEEDLTKLYEKIVIYNSIIDEALQLGEFRTEKDFHRINSERETLHSQIEKILNRLSYLHLKCIS